ncbi:MAG: imidazole glycerol phosphate synthase subunit HisF [Nitrospirae bacterium]|nr:imidazole glycerol phosphate synthase subunit HisF [Nitrospirota bacterium]
MFKPRVIPCLLLQNKGLVKTIKFKDPTYVGDPINAIKIFNEKGVDELIFIDIEAAVRNSMPKMDVIEKIATECFMPVCYGGGIRNISIIKDIFSIGIEKVSVSSYAVENPKFIQETSERFGSQSIVVCIDVKKNIFGKYEVVTHNAGKKTGVDPVQHAKNMEKMGAGEILLNSVDRDGTMQGYDLNLLQRVADAVNVPVIASGGAGKLEDFTDAVKKGHASAVAAGSMFVFYGKHRAVLINYPEEQEIDKISQN